MGYDINFYCVKKVPGTDHHFQLFSPVRFKQISTGSRGRQWHDLFYFHQAPQYQVPDLDLSWMKSEKETPEEFDEIEPENVFDGEGVVFHPQLIWQDLQKVQRQIDHHLDDLPRWYGFQVQMADAEQPFSTSWCWMVQQGELWGFDGGWNCCEGTPTEIRFYDPNQPPDPRFHRTYPDFAAFPDPARKIHGWDFPATGLSGYVLGRAAHVMDAARLQHLAFEREKNLAPQDRIWMQSQSYEDVFRYQLEGLAHVCRFALEHDCLILVDHNV